MNMIVNFSKLGNLNQVIVNSINRTEKNNASNFGEQWNVRYSFIHQKHLLLSNFLTLAASFEALMNYTTLNVNVLKMLN